MFRAYDLDGKGHLDGAEMQLALADMGARCGCSVPQISECGTRLGRALQQPAHVAKQGHQLTHAMPAAQPLRRRLRPACIGAAMHGCNQSYAASPRADGGATGGTSTMQQRRNSICTPSVQLLAATMA